MARKYDEDRRTAGCTRPGAASEEDVRVQQMPLAASSSGTREEHAWSGSSAWTVAPLPWEGRKPAGPCGRMGGYLGRDTAGKSQSRVPSTSCHGPATLLKGSRISNEMDMSPCMSPSFRAQAPSLLSLVNRCRPPSRFLESYLMDCFGDVGRGPVRFLFFQSSRHYLVL